MTSSTLNDVVGDCFIKNRERVSTCMFVRSALKTNRRENKLIMKRQRILLKDFIRSISLNDRFTLNEIPLNLSMLVELIREKL